MLCHGYPDPTTGSLAAGSDLSELGNRIATTMGWRVFTFRFQGCGSSQGNFSLSGWRDDILAAMDHLAATVDADTVWLSGFGTGGALCIAAAAERPDHVHGVATMSAPAEFDDWASHTRRLIQHSRKLGVIRHPDFPGPGDDFAESLHRIRPVDEAARIADIPMLVLHGDEDDAVPVFDARVLADAHGTAELRIINGAGHGLRYDPRVVAILLGWLVRTRDALQIRQDPYPTGQVVAVPETPDDAQN